MPSNIVYHKELGVMLLAVRSNSEYPDLCHMCYLFEERIGIEWCGCCPKYNDKDMILKRVEEIT